MSVKKSTTRTTFLILALAFVSALLIAGVTYTACGISEDGNQPSAIECDEAEKSSISGRVIIKSDVQTIPDTRAGGGLVVAIPSGEFTLLLDEAEIENWEGSLRSARLRICKELFEAHTQASAKLQPDGSYCLPLPPGSSVVCLANLGETRPELFPVNVQGCLEIVIYEGQRYNLNIYFGLGGVTSPYYSR